MYCLGRKEKFFFLSPFDIYIYIYTYFFHRMGMGGCGVLQKKKKLEYVSQKKKRR